MTQIEGYGLENVISCAGTQAIPGFAEGFIEGMDLVGCI